MTTQQPSAPRADIDWLALRARADARARVASLGLLAQLNEHIARRAAGAGSGSGSGSGSGTGPGTGTGTGTEPEATTARMLRVYDLGAGAGANLRWLSPRLPSGQAWTLIDLDAELLSAARRERREHPTQACVDLEARVERLESLGAVLAERPRGSGESVVTCSAVLDVLTQRQIEHVVDAASRARAPVLASLSVTGEVGLSPSHESDEAITAAFNAHQRRDARVGPEAVEIATAALRRHGYAVTTARTPWQLGADDADLLSRYLAERIDAACEQHPDLRMIRRDWLAARTNDIDAGRLRVQVEHIDLLGLPQ